VALHHSPTLTSYESLPSLIDPSVADRMSLWFKEVYYLAAAWLAKPATTHYCSTGKPTHHHGILTRRTELISFVKLHTGPLEIFILAGGLGTIHACSSTTPAVPPHHRLHTTILQNWTLDQNSLFPHHEQLRRSLNSSIITAWFFMIR
jgi:hypothetical protein